MRPVLFAETPRAGRWNHRFLIPSHVEVDQSRLATWASRARRHDRGDDYLAAIRRNVVQASGGREGDELLVLAGIETDTLSSEIRDQLKGRLECRMDDLENLVQSQLLIPMLGFRRNDPFREIGVGILARADSRETLSR